MEFLNEGKKLWKVLEFCRKNFMATPVGREIGDHLLMNEIIKDFYKSNHVLP